MHQHRPSSTLTLKFPESKAIKEVSESESETDFDMDSDGEHEFQEKVVVVQLKKQKMDLDGGSGSKTMPATASGGGGGGAALQHLVCKVEKCNSDLKECKQYHKKHRVCEYHAKAQAATVDGLMQRFCQQCSRFHELAEFDDTKRSCRRRLQGHNARRRKSSTEAGLAPKKDDCRIVEERGHIAMVFPKNHQNLHIH